MGEMQAKMKSTLEKAGLPYKEIEVYGRQIVITAWSEDAANKWAHLLARFSKVRGVIPALDYAKENKGTVLLPTTINVFRTFAVMR